MGIWDVISEHGKWQQEGDCVRGQVARKRKRMGDVPVDR